MWPHPPLRQYECAALTVGDSEHRGLPEVFPIGQRRCVYGWFRRWARPVRTATTLTAPLLRPVKAQTPVTRLSTGFRTRRRAGAEPRVTQSTEGLRARVRLWTGSGSLFAENDTINLFDLSTGIT
jgi:hypothetical protein